MRTFKHITKTLEVVSRRDKQIGLFINYIWSSRATISRDHDENALAFSISDGILTIY